MWMGWYSLDDLHDGHAKHTIMWTEMLFSKTAALSSWPHAGVQLAKAADMSSQVTKAHHLTSKPQAAQSACHILL